MLMVQRFLRLVVDTAEANWIQVFGYAFDVLIVASVPRREFITEYCWYQVWAV